MPPMFWLIRTLSGCERNAASKKPASGAPCLPAASSATRKLLTTVLSVSASNIWSYVLAAVARDDGRFSHLQRRALLSYRLVPQRLSVTGNDVDFVQIDARILDSSGEFSTKCKVEVAHFCHGGGVIVGSRST